MLFHGLLLLIAVIAAIATVGLLLFSTENKGKAIWTGGISAAVVLMSMILIIGPGHARVGVIFGNMDQHVYGQGFHLVNPLMGFEDYSTKRVAIDFQSPSGTDGNNTDNLLTQTSDQIAITVDVTFAFQLNASCLPWLYQHIGDQNQVDETFLRPIARSAVRDSTPRFSLQETIVTKRGELEATLTEVFSRKTVESLVAQGMSQAQARTCVTVLPTQLRRTEPPRPILEAQAQYAATQRNLETAGVTVQIQERLAQARRAEGEGLRNLANAAPPGWTARDVALVQKSQANLMLAQATKAAVDGDRVPIIVTNGGGTTIQVPQQ